MQRRMPTKAFFCVVTLAFLIFTAFAGSASAQNAVGFTTPPPIGQYVIQGCNNDGTLNFPSTNNAEGGGFVCPDSAYTTGNLGKNWNELDLVPFRVTTSTSKSTTTTTYNLVIAGEFSRTGVIGWDVIGSDAGTGPTKNPNSDASCSATWNGFFTNGPGIGGSDSSIYRTLTITQNPGSTCIWDYYMRLSAEASNYSGSNLHGFMFETAGFTQGKSDVPIPVSFGVQAIAKDMTATQPTQIVWGITKSPSPASLSFGNVCDTTTPLSQKVTFKVDWTASAPQPDGSITITTHVYASNPAHRSITVSATDKVFVGAGPGGTLLHTTTGSPVVVPANTTNFLILTDTVTDTNQSDTAFNDQATGNYSDPVTGVPVTETTTATASATVTSNSPINGSATIEDTETISPFPTFSFSLDSFTGSGGFTGGAVSSPSGYTLGTQVTSVPLVWDSNSVTSSGEVVFNKTVDFNGTGSGSDTGTLSDQAVVKNGSTVLAGPTAASVTGVSSAPQVKLTITKTITPSPFNGASAVSFTFHVKNSSNVEVAGSPFTITFNPGDSSPKSNGPITLDPSVYTITEDPVTGWITDPTPHTVDLSASSSAACTGNPTFSNTEQGHIIVNKVTNPSGSKQSFSFTTGGSGYSGFSLTDGTSNDSGPLNPGSYSVAETAVTGWDLTSATCDGTGNTPASITLGAGQTVHCTFNNSKPDANITITPGTATNAVGQSHTFTITVTQIPNGDTPATTVNILPNISPAPSTQSTTCSSAVAFSGNVATCTLTISSTTAGVFTANATANLTIGTVALTRATGDSNAGDSGPATKTYVDAQITISPLAATNEVNHPHTITATVSENTGSSSLPAPDGTTVTFTLLNNAAGATFVNGISSCTTTSGTCSVQINTSTAGGVDIHATTTFSVGGVSLTRATGDGLSGDSGNAHKTYVDARIAVSPLTATNEVNHTHTITATVSQDDGIPAGAPGDGVTGFGPAPNGTLVTFTLLNNTATASFVGGINTCTTTGGTCSVQINTSTAGGVDIHAATTFSVGGVSLTRATGDGLSGDSANAHKTYVAGQIKVVKVTNPAGSSQSFSFTPSYETGFSLTGQAGSNSNLSGFLAPGNTYSVSETLPAGWDQTGASCDNGTPGAINVVAGATTTCTFTNSKPDANITIGPTTATNPVNKQHTFTIVVTQIPNGDTPATSAAVTTNITPAGFTPVSDNCDGSPVAFVGNTATCTVVINSTTPTTYTANATAVVKIGSQTLTRATGDSNAGDSGPATKIYQAGQIKVVKVTNPAGSSQSFTFTPSYEAGFSLTGQAGSNSNLSGFLAPGSTYSVSETLPTGWLQTGASCDNGTPGAINVVAGATTTCTFTNTQEAKLQVNKTQSGGPIPAGSSFQFDLRQGASTVSAGTILEGPLFATSTTPTLNFTTFLVPGQHYQLCETLLPGWSTNMGSLFVVFNPSGANNVLCTDFVATPGQTVTFNIDNTPPPGGIALTIGFWKNWSSCSNSNGHQKFVLDQTLAKMAGGGDQMGNLFVNTCTVAVDILSKSNLNGKKEASNPFYNMAAQLLAADLNVTAGAGTTSCVLQDITNAHALLTAVGFDGVSNTTGTAAQQAEANALQTQLNNYNNNLPVACVP